MQDLLNAWVVEVVASKVHVNLEWEWVGDNFCITEHFEGITETKPMCTGLGECRRACYIMLA